MLDASIDSDMEADEFDDDEAGGGSGRDGDANPADIGRSGSMTFPPPPDVQFIKLDNEQASRIFYSNPVCFLTTANVNSSSSSSNSKSKSNNNSNSNSNNGSNSDVPGPVNVMTLSWIMPSNNYGGFSFTIHKSRYSYLNLLGVNATFVLR